MQRTTPSNPKNLTLIISAILCLSCIPLATFIYGVAGLQCNNPTFKGHSSGSPTEVLTTIVNSIGGLPRSNVELTLNPEEMQNVDIFPVHEWQIVSTKVENGVSQSQLQYLTDDDPSYAITSDIEVEYENGDVALLRWTGWRYGLIVCPLVINYGDGPLGELEVIELQTSTNQPETLLDYQENDIRLGAVFDPVAQRADGMIQYDYLSEEAVRAYLQFNAEQSELIAGRPEGSLHARILFNGPLSQAEFETFVSDYALQVHRYRIRAIGADGIRATINGAPEGGQLVPDGPYTTVLEDLETRQTEVNGWFEVDVTTTTSTFASLQDDPRVYLTEAAYTMVFDALTIEALASAGAAQDTIAKIQDEVDYAVQISDPGLYWGLENLNLVGH